MLKYASNVIVVCISCIAREAFLLAVFAVVVSSPTGFDHGVESLVCLYFTRSIGRPA